MFKQIVPIPNIIEGILMGFLSILMVSVTYQFVEPILLLFDSGSLIYWTAYLIMWLVYFSALYIFIWVPFFKPKEETNNA